MPHLAQGPASWWFSTWGRSARTQLEGSGVIRELTMIEWGIPFTWDSVGYFLLLIPARSMARWCHLNEVRKAESLLLWWQQKVIQLLKKWLFLNTFWTYDCLLYQCFINLNSTLQTGSQHYSSSDICGNTVWKSWFFLLASTWCLS